MTREIKFRAHCEGKIYQVTEIMWSDNHVYLWDGGDKGGGLFNLFDVDLMQFTGLKDKNGKEIYEGDVLESGNVKSPVSFSAGCFVIQESDGMRDLGAALDDHDSHVAGNIYENAELLK